MAEKNSTEIFDWKEKDGRKYYLPGETCPEDVLFSASGHKHLWHACEHEGKGSRGNVLQCERVSDFDLLTHEVCEVCGQERFPDGWIYIVDQILLDRKRKIKASQATPLVDPVPLQLSKQWPEQDWQ